jgi:WD40 repeat protein
MIDNFEYLLLVCWLLGLTKNPMIAFCRPQICIPWSRFGPNFPISFSKKRRILQRCSLTICLIKRMLRAGNQGGNFERKAYEYTFCRLFTGPGHNSVAHLLCCTRFILRDPTIISPGDSLFSSALIHPKFPIAAIVTNGGMNVQFLFLSPDIKTVVAYENLEPAPERMNGIIAFHEQLPFFASARTSNVVIVYQFSHDEIVPVERLIGHTRDITAISFSKGNSPDIKMATGDEEGTIMVWSMDYTGNGKFSVRCMLTLKSPFVFTWFKRNPVSSIDWCNGHTVAITHFNRHITVIDCHEDKKEVVRSFSPEITGVRCVSFDPNGNFFVTSSDGFIKVWDYSSHDCKFTLKWKDFIHSMVFNESGRILIIGGAKIIWALEVSPNGDGMIPIATQTHGTRIITSVAMQLTGDCNDIAIISGDLSGKIVSSKIVRT